MVSRLMAGLTALDRSTKVQPLRDQYFIRRCEMSGFWINLYNNLAQTKLSGYLYCCNDCNHIIRVQTKLEDQTCPKCGKKVTEDA